MPGGRTVRTIYEVLGKDSASPALNRVNASMRQMQATANSAFKSLAVGAGFMKAGDTMLSFIGNAVGEAKDLEFALAELKGVSGATAEEMDLLANKAKRLGIETQFTPTQAVEGLTNLAQQGFTAAQQLDAVSSVLFLAGASGGKVPLADAAKLTAQTLKAFQKDASDAGIVIDQLVMTTTKSGLAIEELAGALQHASSGAIAMGLDVGESMAALGLIKNIIPSAQMAGSAFQVMTQRLSDPRVQKMLKSKIGLDIVDKATGKYKDFGKTLVGLSGGMMKLSESARGALIGEAFGARAKKGILSIMAQLEKGITTQTGEVLKGQKAWDYWMKTLDPKHVEGFAKSLNDLKLDTLEGQLTLLSGSMQTFMGELGKGVAAITKSGIKGILSVFNGFLDVFSSLPQPVKNVISGFIAMSGVIMKVVGGIFILKGVMSLLGISFGSVLLSIGKILLLSGPLLLMFGAMGVAVYGVARAIKKDIGGVGSTWSDMWKKAKTAFQGTIDLITHGGMSEGVMKELNKAENLGLKKFMVTITEWVGKAKRFFAGMMDGLDAGLERIKGPLNDLKKTIMDLFGDWFKGTQEGGRSLDEWEAKGANFGAVLSELSALFLKGVKRALEFGATIAEAFKDVTIEDVVDGIKTMFNTIGGIAAGVQEVTEFFRALFKVIHDIAKTLFTIWQHTDLVAILGKRLLGIDKATEGIKEREKIADMVQGQMKQLSGKLFGPQEKGKEFLYAQGAEPLYKPERMKQAQTVQENIKTRADQLAELQESPFTTNKETRKLFKSLGKANADISQWRLMDEGEIESTGGNMKYLGKKIDDLIKATERREKMFLQQKNKQTYVLKIGASDAGRLVEVGNANLADQSMSGTEMTEMEME